MHTMPASVERMEEVYTPENTEAIETIDSICLLCEGQPIVFCLKSQLENTHGETFAAKILKLLNINRVRAGVIKQCRMY